MDKNLTILKLHIIRFAGITEQVFTFDTGINVIYGENRSGKTTLCEFIRFMYYGFDGRDPEDYYPYGDSNRSVCGSMTVKYGAKTLEIFREKSDISEIAAVTDVDKNIALELDCQPGEYFMGFSAALYDKSLYCPQDMAGLASSGDLAEFENELIRAYSGENNFSGLSLALKNRRRELSNPEKSGKADIVRAELASLDGELVSAIMKQNEIMNVGSTIAEMENKLLEAEKKRVLIKAELEELHGENLREESRQIQAAAEDISRKKKTYERLSALALSECDMQELEQENTALCQMSQSLSALETRLANTKSNLDMHTDMTEGEEYDSQTLESVSHKLEGRDKLARGLFIASLPIFVMGAVSFLVLFLAVKTLTLDSVVWISGGITALSLLSLIAALATLLSKNTLYKSVGMNSAEEFEDAYELMVSLAKTTDLYRDTYRDEARLYKEKAQEYSAALSALAVKLGLGADTASAEDIEEAMEAARTACRKADTALKDYNRALEQHRHYGSEEIRQRNIQKTLRLEALERELALCNSQSTALFEKKRSMEEVFSTAVIHTERPAYIKTRINELKKTLDEYQKDITALDIARDVLEDALGVMKFRIKTHLSDGVNDALKFTLGENESFVLDDSYSLQYKNASRLVPVFTDSISRSSRIPKGISRSLCEMSAIALRMSLIKLLECETGVAVLDEPFAFMDSFGEDKLMRRISNSDMWQVFIFTSRNTSSPQEKYNYVKIN